MVFWLEQLIVHHIDLIPPNSPDLAPSDYHLFRSMTHGLAEQHFRSYEETEKWVDSWIASKPTSFFRDGIRKLPERWEKVVASDGQYFDWLHCNRFFTIKPQISRKNRANLFVPLLIIVKLHIVSWKVKSTVSFTMRYVIKRNKCTPRKLKTYPAKPNI